MAITVSTSRSNSISVAQGSSAEGTITVKKPGDMTLQSLKNVVTTDLQDGYTLVYDVDTNKWIAQPLTGTAVDNVDGGTY